MSKPSKLELRPEEIEYFEELAKFQKEVSVVSGIPITKLEDGDGDCTYMVLRATISIFEPGNASKVLGIDLDDQLNVWFAKDYASGKIEIGSYFKFLGNEGNGFEGTDLRNVFLTWVMALDNFGIKRR